MPPKQPHSAPSWARGPDSARSAPEPRPALPRRPRAPRSSPTRTTSVPPKRTSVALLSEAEPPSRAESSPRRPPPEQRTGLTVPSWPPPSPLPGSSSTLRTHGKQCYDLNLWQSLISARRSKSRQGRETPARAQVHRSAPQAGRGWGTAEPPETLLKVTLKPRHSFTHREPWVKKLIQNPMKGYDPNIFSGSLCLLVC